MTREPAGRAGGGKVGVDGDFDEVGGGDVADRFDDDGECRDASLELVGREVAEEAAQQRAVVDFAHYIVVGALGICSLRGFLFFFLGHCSYFRGCEGGEGFKLA